jgi:hypothetical protein
VGNTRRWRIILIAAEVIHEASTTAAAANPRPFKPPQGQVKGTKSTAARKSLIKGGKSASLEQEGRFVVGKRSHSWLKPGIWGAVIGVIGIVVLGFWQLGWVLGSKADEMAHDRASTAVAEALAPVCAAKFFAQTDASAKLADLKKLASDYGQREFVEKGGGASATVSDASDYQLISECTKRILAGKPA